MPFQALDNKGSCVGVYDQGRLVFDELPETLSCHTWNYSQFLKDRDIEYASLYCGKTLEQACPEHYEAELQLTSDKLKAFLKSLRTAKIDLNENCFYDLVPERFLLEYCDVKNKITQHVINNYEKPKNYDFLLDMTKVIEEIKTQKLTINRKALIPSAHKFKTRQFMKKILRTEPYIDYKLFGTKTGRLTTRKGTFPILTLDKQHRCVLEPTNDWFVELDFNAAELRTMLSLSGQKQPQEDIHKWNIKNVFKQNITRDEAKTRIFAWLYGSEKESKRLSTTDAKEILRQTYQRERIISEYWTGSHVRTRFNRTIPSDNHHALSYIIQSSCVDNVNRQLVKLHDRVSNYRTRVAFTLHDSIILDIPNDERKLIPELINIFADTELGNFRVNVSAGKNFGDLKRLNL